jgi:hypothetical protein
LFRLGAHIKRESFFPFFLLDFSKRLFSFFLSFLIPSFFLSSIQVEFPHVAPAPRNLEGFGSSSSTTSSTPSTFENLGLFLPTRFTPVFYP